ncbi:hypothetical protein NL676_022320 [Syzygium grande]|nr:hypothetical protein NL676_022320 [Syzygium grande]
MLLSASLGTSTFAAPLPSTTAITSIRIRSTPPLPPCLFQTLRASGDNNQFVFDYNPGEGGSFRIPRNINLGDYYFGSNLEQLLQQLAENDLICYGTPPVSESAMNGLPVIKISEEFLALDNFVVPGLYELPTDDPDYEQRNGSSDSSSAPA